MEQDIETTTGASAIDRRDFIRKTAIVGGMVWAAPAMSTLGSRAFADPGTLIIEEDCINFINFKIEMVGGVWKFVSCPGSGSQGTCFPIGWDFDGDCVSGPGIPLAAPLEGVMTEDGRIMLTVEGNKFTLTVADGCEILRGGAAGGQPGEDRCVYFQPNGTEQTWDAELPSADLSNIVGYICCDSPFSIASLR